MKNEYIAGDLVKYLSQVVKIVEVYQDGTCNFNEVFENRTFVDGLPFGVKVEE